MGYGTDVCRVWIRNLCERGELNAGEIAVMNALANYADEENSCFPSYATLATYTGYERRSVVRIIGRLAERGLISVVERKRDNGSRTSNRYVLAAGRAQVQTRKRKPAPQVQDSDQGSLPLVTEGPQGSDRGSPPESSSLKNNSTPNGVEVARRRRAELFDMLVHVCRYDASKLTRNERGRLNAAVKQLYEVEAHPDEVRLRSIEYRARYQTMVLTPQALVSNWSSLAKEKPTSAQSCPQCGQLLANHQDIFCQELPDE